MFLKNIFKLTCNHIKILKTNNVLLSQEINLLRIKRCFSGTRSLQFLDVRDKDHEKKSGELIIHQGSYFDEVAKKAKDKKTYNEALDLYIKKNAIHRRGHVEFLYAALDRMKEFNVHRDIDTYRKLLEIFPKYKMIPKNVWQIEFMHYPKQQQCAIDILDFMEGEGVVPDDDFGYQLRDLFGQKSHAFRKYMRMMYWMPKFKFANPYYVPYDLPSDTVELAKMAVRRMCVDLETRVSVFDTSELDTASDKTFIVSCQSPTQMTLLKKLPKDQPIVVEGGFLTRLRSASLTYFVLKSEKNDDFLNFLTKREIDYTKKSDENAEMNLYTFDKEYTEYRKSILIPPSIHEQEDGIILAMCITGTSSKDSLASWVKFLERTNPSLSKLPVLFMLKSATNEIEIVDGQNKNTNDNNSKSSSRSSSGGGGSSGT